MASACVNAAIVRVSPGSVAAATGCSAWRRPRASAQRDGALVAGVPGLRGRGSDCGRGVASMKRRSFFAVLAALPFVGRLLGGNARAGQQAGEVILFHRLDDFPITCAMVSPYCPDGNVYGTEGVLIIPASIARRLPSKDAVIIYGGGSVHGWALTGEVAPARGHIGSLVTRMVT